MNEQQSNLGVEGIYDANSMQFENTNTPFMPRGMGMDVNSVGIAGIMNRVDSSLFEGETKTPSTGAYYHQGQHNPNAFQQQDGSGIDQSSVKNLMGHIKELEPHADSMIGNLGEDDLHTVGTVISQIEKIIAMMTEDLDLWVPSEMGDMTPKLESVGNKIVPYLRKYVEIIRHFQG